MSAGGSGRALLPCSAPSRQPGAVASVFLPVKVKSDQVAPSRVVAMFNSARNKRRDLQGPVPGVQLRGRVWGSPPQPAGPRHRCLRALKACAGPAGSPGAAVLAPSSGGCGGRGEPSRSLSSCRSHGCEGPGGAAEVVTFGDVRKCYWEGKGGWWVA